MANNRVFYPVHYIAIGPYCSGSGTPVHGTQSISLNTTFNLEQAFELGQIEIYENIENLPDIELQAEKVLDGYPLIYHLATQGATSPSLNSRFNKRSDVFLPIFSDSQDASSGVPIHQAYCSGMYVSALTYTLPVQGNCNEKVTLVGNDKVWSTSSFAFNGHFNNLDSPASGVQRRYHVIMGSGGSVWPSEIPGITDFGGGSGYNIETAGIFGAHLQDVTISTSPGRTDLFELGRRSPYYKAANFPTKVTCSISVTAGGLHPGDAINAQGSAISNLTNQAIKIKISDYTKFNLGDKNKLTGTTYSGGDATGGNVSIVYNYENFNYLTVTNKNTDPEGFDQTI